MIHRRRKLWYFPWEALIWLVGLILLIIMPVQEHTHYTLCPIAGMGFDFCPGCGLGRSIQYIFRGQWNESLHAHPLGTFAVIILSFRIVLLTKNYYKLLWQK